MTLGSEEGGNDDLKLSAEQQELCKYFGEKQEEEQAERQEQQAPGDPLREAPIIEEVMEGDEEDSESHGVRQEERETPEDAMEIDEVTEGNTGGGYSASFEDVTSVVGG